MRQRRRSLLVLVIALAALLQPKPAEAGGLCEAACFTVYASCCIAFGGAACASYCSSVLSNCLAMCVQMDEEELDAGGGGGGW
jgi:hypothetical protein